MIHTIFYDQTFDEALELMVECWDSYLKLLLVKKLETEDASANVSLAELVTYMFKEGKIPARNYEYTNLIYYEFFRISQSIKLIGSNHDFSSIIPQHNINDPSTWIFYHDNWSITEYGQRIAKNGIDDFARVYHNKQAAIFNYIKNQQEKY